MRRRRAARLGLGGIELADDAEAQLRDWNAGTGRTAATVSFAWPFSHDQVRARRPGLPGGDCASCTFHRIHLVGRASTLREVAETSLLSALRASRASERKAAGE